MLFSRKVKLSRHAAEQCACRGIATPDEVLGACRGHEREIEASEAYQVKVIIKRLAYEIRTSGSEGSVVVACVDPKTLVVKTVMLERPIQVKYRAASGRTGEYIE